MIHEGGVMFFETYLQVLQNERTVFAERLHETEHARIFGRDAVGDGRGNADDLLEHLNKGVAFVFARFDLAGFHAEGGGEIEALQSAVCR